MIWLQPAAVLGLLALAGPILVHLLRRQQAQRVIVPTTRFVRAVTDSAVRLRRPSDLLLLLVRMSIVALAVAALAGPLWLSAGRLEDWNGRTVRAVVIDSSPSVAAAIAPDVTAAQVAGAYASRVIEATDLGDGLRRAAAWLRIAPPARREIVVVSDFQNGSLNQQDTEVEDEFGLRFVAVTTGPPPPAPVGDVFADGTRRQVRADLAAGRTGARFEPAIGPEWSGLEIQGASAEEVAFLQRVVARAGTWAPDAALPMVIRFGPLATGGNAVHLSREQVLRMQRLLGSEAIQGLTHRAGVHDDKPLLEVDVDPSSFAAAAAVRAALDSIRDPASMREYDPLRIPPSVLAGWSREAAPVDASVARHADRHDGRWLWGGVLLLLAAETLLRRSHHAVRDEDRARAA